MSVVSPPQKDLFGSTVVLGPFRASVIRATQNIFLIKLVRILFRLLLRIV